ncbi:MAG: hypothetical protein ACRDWI_03995 [Jiangellaceae bacterium]
MPRQLIVDNLIKPLNPEAVVMDIRNTMPFMPDYEVQLDGVGAEPYQDVDIEGARAILEETGNIDLQVRIGYQAPNPRRTQTVELIRDSCGQAGFEIVDAGSETFFGTELPQNQYDVSLFGWAGSALVSGWGANYTTVWACDAEAKGNNYGCYSNPQVDELVAEVTPRPTRMPRPPSRPRSSGSSGMTWPPSRCSPSRWWRPGMTSSSGSCPTARSPRFRGTCTSGPACRTPKRPVGPPSPGALVTGAGPVSFPAPGFALVLVRAQAQQGVETVASHGMTSPRIVRVSSRKPARFRNVMHSSWSASA